MKSTSPILAAPRTPRELLTAFASYDDSLGVDSFLDQFDFTGIMPHQVYYSALGRLPESSRAAQMPLAYDARHPLEPLNSVLALPEYDAKQHYQELLTGSEFRHMLMERILHAFPEKRRTFFVHIPKCAGIDLMLHLHQRYPGAGLGPLITHAVQVPGDVVLQRLRRLALQDAGMIAVMGHVPLNEFVSARLIRKGDIVFSVIREPFDMALSMVNFAMTVMATPPHERTQVHRAFASVTGSRPDTWGLPDNVAERKQLALTLLHDRRLLPGNNLCHYLGNGNFDSALELSASVNIELTTVSRYAEWLAQRWGVERSVRANESYKYLTRADLGESDLTYLADITREDACFYRHVDSRLSAMGRSSLFASELQ